MIRADTLRPVLAAEDPFTAVDALIRATLAAGHRVADVYDRFVELMPEVETWPEYAGDGADAFDGALDALGGVCHPNWRYTDAPVGLNGAAHHDKLPSGGGERVTPRPPGAAASP